MRRTWTAGALMAGVIMAATGAAGYAALTGSAVVSGKAITAVKTVGQGETDVDGWGPMTSTWAQMRGVNDTRTPIAVSMTVPRGHTALFRATLSGNASCALDRSETGANGTCEVRVVVNGAPMEPQIMEFGIPNAAAGETAVFFTTTPLRAGTYRIAAQWRNLGAPEAFWMFSSMLTVDQIQVS